MTNEEWYDAEIAPKLKTLADQCRDRDMAFLGIVEYAPGDRGRTQNNLRGAGLEMKMLVACCHAGKNIDGYFFWLAKYCESNGFDTNSSYVMRRLSQAGGE